MVQLGIFSFYKKNYEILIFYTDPKEVLDAAAILLNEVLGFIPK